MNDFCCILGTILKYVINFFAKKLHFGNSFVLFVILLYCIFALQKIITYKSNSQKAFCGLLFIMYICLYIKYKFMIFDDKVLIVNPIYYIKGEYLKNSFYIGKKVVSLDLKTDIISSDGFVTNKIYGEKRMTKRNYKFTVASDSALIKAAKRSLYMSVIVVFIAYSKKFKSLYKKKCNDGTLYIEDKDLIDDVTYIYQDIKFISMSRKSRLEMIKDVIEQLIDDRIVYRVRNLNNIGCVEYYENLYVIDPFEYSNGEDLSDIYCYMKEQWSKYKSINGLCVLPDYGLPDYGKNDNNISDIDFKGYLNSEILNSSLTPQSAILKILLIMYSKGIVSFKVNVSKFISLSSRLFGVGISRRMIDIYINDLIRSCVVEVDSNNGKGRYLKFSNMYKPDKVCDNVISYLSTKGVDIIDI